MSAISKILQLLVKSAAKEAPKKSNKVGKILGELKDSPPELTKTKAQIDTNEVHRDQNDIMETLNKLNAKGKASDDQVAAQAELLFNLATRKK